jgi:cell division protein FtsW (lipid II flippase)
MINKDTKGIDWPLLLTVAWQLLASIALFYAGTASGVDRNPIKGSNPLPAHLFDVLVAVVLAIAAYRFISATLLKKYPLRFLLAAVALMVLPLLPDVGYLPNVSAIWPNAGPWAIYVYPLVLLLAVVYYSDILARYRRGDFLLTHFSLKVVGLCLLFFVLAIGQNDMLCAGVMLAVLLLMCAVAGAKLLASGIATSFALSFSYLFLTSAYRRDRLFNFFVTFDDEFGRSFQWSRSLSVIRGGDATGVGLGNGLALSAPLPVAHGNFFYTPITEQTGVLGACLLLFTSLLILWRGITIARHLLKADRHVEGLLVSGLIGWIGLTTLTHVAITLRLSPGSRCPYPLLSCSDEGGAVFLCAYLMAFALVLKLGSEAPAPPTGEYNADSTS